MNQIEIDFSKRGQQLRLRDALQFGPGFGCQPVSLKAVFVAVDSYAGENGWCTACHQSIATRANVSERTARRALSILLELFLVRKQTRRTAEGFKVCRYRVTWSNVSAWVDDFQSDADVVESWTECEPAETERQPIESGDHPTVRPTVNRQWANGQSIGGQRSIDGGPTVNRAGANGQGDRQPTSNPNKPPLPPKTPADRPAGLEEEEAVVELLAATPGRPDRICVSEALELARQVDLQTCVRILAEYDHPANRRHFRGPGAIAHRIRFGQWPTPKAATLEALQAADTARQAKADAERDAERLRQLEAAQAAQAADQLECQAGPILDSMTDQQRQDLAAAVLDPFNLERFHRNRDACRAELLEAIAEVGHTATNLRSDI